MAALRLPPTSLLDTYRELGFETLYVTTVRVTSGEARTRREERSGHG